MIIIGGSTGDPGETQQANETEFTEVGHHRLPWRGAFALMTRGGGWVELRLSRSESVRWRHTTHPSATRVGRFVNFKLRRGIFRLIMDSLNKSLGGLKFP
jgi:hypothetical protein